MGQTVLVTGVSRYLGGEFARRIGAHPDVDRVIGIDVIPPAADLGGAEFIRADIRNPVISKIIERYDVDTVAHMNVIATPTRVGGRASMKEINVIGSMQLLAACQKSTKVRHLIVKSTAGVYGSSPKDPALFTEDMSAKVLPRAGWSKDSVEVEGYVRAFSRRRPAVRVAVLRFANFAGPHVRTAMTDYFELPVVPTVLGYDPRMQFIHEDDGLRAMEHATVGDYHGTVNVTGSGVLTVSQVIGLVGRTAMPVPAPLVRAVAQGMRQSGMLDFTSDQLAFLTYGRALDDTRMRTQFGFAPEYTSRQAVEAFAEHASAISVSPKDVVNGVERFSATLFKQARRAAAKATS